LQKEILNAQAALRKRAERALKQAYISFAKRERDFIADRNKHTKGDVKVDDEIREPERKKTRINKKDKLIVKPSSSTDLCFMNESDDEADEPDAPLILDDDEQFGADFDSEYINWKKLKGILN